jgi:hypothetical protein
VEGRDQVQGAAFLLLVFVARIHAFLCRVDGFLIRLLFHKLLLSLPQNSLFLTEEFQSLPMLMLLLSTKLEIPDIVCKWQTGQHTSGE